MSLARVRSLIILGALVLVAVVVVTWTILSDDQTQVKATGRHCDKGEQRATTTIPKEKDVNMHVYNSTDRPGLAESTAHTLEGYKFHIIDYKQDPTGAVVNGTAQIRYGRKAVGAAQLVRAYVPDAVGAYDPNRDDANVDLVIGKGFKTLRTGPSDIKEAEISLGQPTPPPGTC